MSSGDLKPLAQKAEITLSLAAIAAFSLDCVNGIGFANWAKALAMFINCHGHLKMSSRALAEFSSDCANGMGFARCIATGEFLREAPFENVIQSA